MQISNAYLPNEVFAPPGQGELARVVIAPQRYVQSKDVLAHMGRHLSLVRVRRAGTLISACGEVRHGKVLADSLHAARIDSVVAQLAIESRLDEARRVALFFAQVGLPVHLGQLSIDAGSAGALRTIVEGAMAFPFIGNMPMPIHAAVLRKGLLGAHELGLAVREQAGDASYRRLHGG